MNEKNLNHHDNWIEVESKKYHKLTFLHKGGKGSVSDVKNNYSKKQRKALNEFFGLER